MHINHLSVSLNLRRVLLFTYWCLLLLVQATGYSTPINKVETKIDYYSRFINITVQDGLSNNLVLDIIQDKYGQMWFATANGLTRFDGFHYTIYRNEPEHPNSLSNNLVTSLTEDSDGNLWIGTQNGLNRYERDKDHFSRFFADKENNNSLRSNHIKALYADKNECLWIECNGGFLSKYEIRTQKWEHVSHSANEVEGKYYYHHIFEDSKNNLWVGGRLTSIAKIPRKQMSAIINPVLNKDETYFDPGCFVETTDHKLLCASYEGNLGVFSPEEGCFKTILHLPLSTTSAIQAHERNVWIGGKLGGIVQVDLTNNSYCTLQHNPDDPNSLASNEVFCLYKDHNDNVWAGTDKGVSLYPTKLNHVRHFRKMQKKNSPSSNNITALMQDQEGLIWVGTENNGVDTFRFNNEHFGNLTYNLLTSNLSRNTFEREKQNLRQYFRHEVITSSSTKSETIFDNYATFRNTPLHFVSLNENKVSALYEDKSGKVYVGLWSHVGFNVFDRKSQTFKRYCLWSKKPDYLYPNLLEGNPFGSNWYCGFLEDNLNRFWCATWEGFGLNLFDRQAGEFSNKHYMRNSYPHSSSIIKSSGIDKESGRIYMAGGKYYGYYDIKKQAFIKYGEILPADYPNREILNKYFEYCQGELIHIPVHYREMDMLYDENGYVWLTGHNFVAKHTLATNKIETIISLQKEAVFNMVFAPDKCSVYLSQNNKLYRISALNNTIQLISDTIGGATNKSPIRQMYACNKEELWLGTDSGLYVYNMLSEKLSHIIINSGKNTKITAITGNAKGELLVGSSVGLIQLHNGKQKRIMPFNTPETDGIPGSMILHIQWDESDNLWLATNYGLVCRYADNQKHNTIFRHDESDPYSIPHDYVVHTFVGPDHNLWVSTKEGISILNRKTLKFTNLSIPGSNSLSSRLASCIMEDNTNAIWLGTTEKGINVLDPKTDKIRHYIHQAWDTTGIPDNTINCLLQDSQNRIWIGTEKGLCKYVPEQDNFIKTDTLTERKIRNIVEDKNRYLWITTDNGLFCLDPSGKFYRCFKSYHGFQNNDYSSAACRLHNGYLAVGGNDGFNLFDPRYLVQPTPPAPIILSNFKTGAIPLYNDLNGKNKIKLEYKENSFSLDFCAADYVYGKQLNYRYRLYGFNLHKSDTQYPYLNAKYTNIPPGDYTFEVEVSNCYGEWCGVVRTIDIHIATPWYRQLWFIVLSSFLFVISIIAIIRLRERKLKRDKAKLEKIVMERTQALSEAIDSKNKFFSIISHDLKNPLKSLRNITHSLYENYNETDEAEKQNSIRLIDQTTQHTDKLLDNLLLWVLSQRDMLSPNPEKVELSLLVDSTFLLLQAAAEKKNILLINNVLPDTLVYTDENMLSTILRNLISNAIKYSYPRGEVIIAIKEAGVKIEIHITDYGIGIPLQNIPYLFRPDSKFQTRGTNHEQGNGLGLIITREFITKLGEHIHVDSEIGKGSIFIFTLNKYTNQ